MAISRPNMWGRSSRNIRGNTLATPSGNEIDLRKEFDEFIYGDEQNIPHGHLCLIRHMRRNSEGRPVYCTCMDNQIAREPDPDCSYCLGEGYLWDEQWHMCYSYFGSPQGGLFRRQIKMPPGMIRVDYKIYYFRYDTNLKYGDKIIEVKLDENGDPEIPYVREVIHKPQTIYKARSDHGRLEFITAYCREEDAIRNDTPV